MANDYNEIREFLAAKTEGRDVRKEEIDYYASLVYHDKMLLSKALVVLFDRAKRRDEYQPIGPQAQEEAPKKKYIFKEAPNLGYKVVKKRREPA